jgi:hypothetical protein
MSEIHEIHEDEEIKLHNMIVKHNNMKLLEDYIKNHPIDYKPDETVKARVSSSGKGKEVAEKLAALRKRKQQSSDC